MLMFICLWHAAWLMKHSLLYVLPSEPQTGDLHDKITETRSTTNYFFHHHLQRHRRHRLKIHFYVQARGDSHFLRTVVAKYTACNSSI